MITPFFKKKPYLSKKLQIQVMNVWLKASTFPSKISESSNFFLLYYLIKRKKFKLKVKFMKCSALDFHTV